MSQGLKKLVNKSYISKPCRGYIGTINPEGGANPQVVNWEHEKNFTWYGRDITYVKDISYLMEVKRYARDNWCKLGTYTYELRDQVKG